MTIVNVVDPNNLPRNLTWILTIFKDEEIKRMKYNLSNVEVDSHFVSYSVSLGGQALHIKTKWE